MSKTIYIKTINDLHELIGRKKAKHPLIAVIDFEDYQMEEKLSEVKLISSLYSIMLKDFNCGEFRYGRSTYDFQEGTLNFFGPEQSLAVKNDSQKSKGWGIFFHPDLIRRSNLGNNIRDYTFFSYSVNEGLQMSQKEREILDSLKEGIKKELGSNMDLYTNELIVSNIELLLNYSKRFYSRQFITRENMNRDFVDKLELYLLDRLEDEKLREEGIPSVKDCAKHLCLSANYLSDLLKKETGKNTKDYIYFYLIEKAKTTLLNSDMSINEVAYSLGFEYPEHFSRLFKKKVGLSPSKYRSQ